MVSCFTEQAGSPPPMYRHLHGFREDRGTNDDVSGCLQDATQEQIERMNNNCAVCWSEMGAPLPRAPMLLMGAGSPALAALNATPLYAPGKSLACGHAFHEACIKQWLAQCHG